MRASVLRWVALGLVGCGLWSVAACREREPSPPHNRNLGDAGTYLLPSRPGVAPRPLKGNRHVEIPDREEAQDVRAPAAGSTRGKGDSTGKGGGGFISQGLRWLTGRDKD